MSSKTKTTATKEDGKVAGASSSKARQKEQDAPTTLVPKLRFPEFHDSDDWQTKLLGDLCKIRTGKKDANEGASDGQYPFFTCAENHIFSRSYSFDAEAILIAGNANVGQTRYYSGKFEAYQRTYVLTDFSGISVPYLYAILNAKLRESLLAHVQVSAMSYIKLPMLQEYALAVPPSPAEQQKIAECLSSVDELMAAQARKVDALKTHKKGLIQQLFPRVAGASSSKALETGEQDAPATFETQPRLRFPEFQNAGEWVEEKLEDLAKRGSGHTPNKTKDEYYNGGIKWVSLADSKRLDNGLISETTIVISEQGIKKSSAVLHPAGSVILSRDAGVGKSAVMSESMAVSQHFIVWTCDKRRLSNWFLYYILQIKKPVFENVASGSTIKTIGLPFFKEMRIAVPQVKEQQRIAECLTSLDDLIAAQTQKLEAPKTHKKGLMQQLFPSPEEAEA